MTYTFTVRDHIIDALTTLGKPATPNEIATATRQVVGSVTSELSKAVNDPEQFSPVARVGEHQYQLTGWSALLPKPTGEPLSDEDEIFIEDEMVPFLLHLPESIQKETSDIEVIQAFAAQASDPQRILKYRPSDLRLPLYRALERAALERGEPVLKYKSRGSYETLVRYVIPSTMFPPANAWTAAERATVFAKQFSLGRLEGTKDGPRMYLDSKQEAHCLTPIQQTVKQSDIVLIRTAAGPARVVTLHALGTVTPEAYEAARELNVIVNDSDATWHMFSQIAFNLEHLD